MDSEEDNVIIEEKDPLSINESNIHPQFASIYSSCEDESDYDRRCPLCDELFEDCNYMLKHITNVHIDKKRKHKKRETIKKRSKSTLIQSKNHIKEEDEIPARITSNNITSKSDELVQSSEHFQQSNGTYLCNICKKTIKTLFRIERHMLLIHPNKTLYQCQDCKRNFKTNHILKKHMRTIHPIENVSNHCVLCVKSFQTPYKLIAHNKVMHSSSNTENNCKFCSKSFKNPYVLNVHIRKTHSYDGSTHKCEDCSRVFQSKHYLQCHKRKVHSKSSENLCVICGKLFKSNIYLNDHIRIVHPSDNTQFKCESCEKVFRNKHYLLLHSRIHRKSGKMTLTDAVKCDS